jgi:hypothetical protein
VLTGLRQWHPVSVELKLSENGVKVPVCIWEDYVFYLELFDNLLWFHVDINRWSAGVKKNFQKDFSSLDGLIGKAIFALIREDDIKLARFAKSIGLSEKCQIDLLDGSKAFIYTSRV